MSTITPDAAVQAAETPPIGGDEITDFRVQTAMGRPQASGLRALLLMLAVLAAGAWYLWLGGRGLWTHGQETSVSAVQLGVGVLALAVALLGLPSFTAWSFWACAAALLGVVAYSAPAMADPLARTRASITIGVALLFLHYLWVRRADYGHHATLRPFQPAEPARPGVMEWLTGSARRENVRIALHNAIAGAGRIRDLPDTALADVAAAAGLKLDGELADDCAWLYRLYLAHFMGGPTPAPEGPDELLHLRALLRLKDTVVNDAHAKIGGELYRARVADATKDRTIDADEKAALDALQGQLALPDAVAAKIRTPAQGEMLEALFFDVLQGGKIDDEGEARLRAAIAQLDAAALEPELAKEIYRARLQWLLKDDALAQPERDAMDAFQAVLRVSDADAQAVRTQESRAAAAEVVQRMTGDGQLSDDEARELGELQQRLGIDVRADQKTRALLDRARAAWQIQHGQLPVVETGVNLDDGEVCHAERRAEWKEWRSIDYGTTYRTRTSVREVHGFFGPYEQATSETTADHDVRTELRTIDTGRLLATSFGILWVGESRNRSWAYADLVDVTWDRHGVVLHEDGAGNVSFKVKDDLELFAMIVGRAMREG